MKVLVVVDMQEDFINGCLGSENAREIVAGVITKIKHFDGEVFYTMDTHSENYLDTREGQKLPVAHCIENSAGWNLIGEIRKLPAFSAEQLVYKKTFGSVTLAEKLLKLHHQTPIEELELIGVCTDICVISNALLIKAFLPEVPIFVDAALCAGVTKESHDTALAAMESCHIEIKNWNRDGQN